MMTRQVNIYLLYNSLFIQCHIKFDYVSDLLYRTRKQIEEKDGKIVDMYF